MTLLIIIIILSLIHIAFTYQTFVFSVRLASIDHWFETAKLKFLEHEQEKHVDAIIDFEQPKLYKSRKRVVHMLLAMGIIFGFFVSQLIAVLSVSELNSFGVFTLGLGFPTGIVLWRVSSKYVQDALSAANIFSDLISLSEQQKELKEQLKKKMQASSTEL